MGSRGERRETVPLVVVLLALALVAGLGALGVRALLAGPEAAAQPTHPDRWDPRVRPLVKIAEKQRGLGFLHPVEVRFLRPAAFERTLRSGEELDAEQREELEQYAATLRALGLLEGDVDLGQALEQTHSTGTLAYYSFDDQTVTVRGTRITPAVRQTLVHELVHVLQDQNFGIGAELERLQEAEQERSGTASAVLRAIVEGDAQRIEQRYARSLPERQRRALAAATRADGERVGRDLAKVPEVVVSMVAAPYVLGLGLVGVAAAGGGHAEVDDLLRDPPPHEAVLLDPLRVAAGEIEAAAVATPELGEGEEELHSGELGAVTWYLVLAERMPPVAALQAADGWDGDAYAAYTRDGTACVRAAYVGEEDADTARMQTALTTWAAQSPSGSASVTRDGERVELEACDPGAEAQVKGMGMGTQGSQAALQLVAVRSALARGLLSADVPRSTARCLAARAVQEYPVARLVDPAFGADDPGVQARMQQLAAGCAD